MRGPGSSAHLQDRETRRRRAFATVIAATFPRGLSGRRAVDV
jgi:hypothetical protein